MNRIVNYILRVTLGLLLTNEMLAQQDPHYTQYMYNMSAINPAYATDDLGMLRLGGLYRTQWVGAVGAPQTLNFFAHTPVSERVEVGLSMISDQIGDVVSEHNFYADFAYIIPLGNNHKLSFGVKAGVTNFATDFNGFVYTDEIPDPLYAENISEFLPNVGTGMYYFTDKYYLGLSVPNMLKSKHIERQNGIVTSAAEEMHFFFTGGYVFDLSPSLKFKPAFMAKAVTGAPISMDFTANFLINDRFELGAAYRKDDAVSGLVNFYLTPNLRIGYAYDYTVSNLGKYNNGSHEIFLLFDLSLLGSGYDKSPRFF